jgi:hypothetical protein
MGGLADEELPAVAGDLLAGRVDLGDQVLAGGDIEAFVGALDDAGEQSQPLFRLLQLTGHLDLAQGAGQGAGQHIEKLVILDQIIVRVAPHHLDRDVLVAGAGGYDEGWDLQAGLLQPVEQGQAVHVRQRIVQQHQGRRISGQQRQHLATGVGDLRLAAEVLHQFPHQGCDAGVVLDDEDALVRIGHGAQVVGSRVTCIGETEITEMNMPRRLTTSLKSSKLTGLRT